MTLRVALLLAAPMLLCGCAHESELLSTTETSTSMNVEGSKFEDAKPVTIEPAEASSSEQVTTAALPSKKKSDKSRAANLAPRASSDATAVRVDEPYLLDTGDQLRVSVYGQPSLSRQYGVGHDGRIAMPLIGDVVARGKTTQELRAVIRDRLGAKYVKDPQVTVDVQQNRPFFILGEVRAAGQYPIVTGMTVETAVAIAGGYSERAGRTFRIARRVQGTVAQVKAGGGDAVKPGDTIYAFEREP